MPAETEGRRAEAIPDAAGPVHTIPSGPVHATFSPAPAHGLSYPGALAPTTTTPMKHVTPVIAALALAIMLAPGVSAQASQNLGVSIGAFNSVSLGAAPATITFSPTIATPSLSGSATSSMTYGTNGSAKSIQVGVTAAAGSFNDLSINLSAGAATSTTVGVSGNVGNPAPGGLNFAAVGTANLVTGISQAIATRQLTYNVTISGVALAGSRTFTFTYTMI
jgi:hypothetical protein